jgi:hypothetical protein
MRQDNMDGRDEIYSENLKRRNYLREVDTKMGLNLSVMVWVGFNQLWTRLL